MKTIYRSTLMTLVLAVLLCGVYPLVVFAVGQVLFRVDANGGIVERGGKPVGARLIGQKFTRPEYFHGRPSANNYDATNSGGTNLGPTSAKLAKSVDDNIKAILAENPGLSAGAVPGDLVTTSASGLDPHVSAAGARVQMARVAGARHVAEDRVAVLVRRHTDDGLVNVLMLNLALDEEIK